MHIPDGLLPPEVLVGGYLATGVLTWVSLRNVAALPDPEAEMPKAALLTAAFFVASWVHIPVPPTSVHLVLNGLMGAVLGWYAFPAILVGLFLQAVMFQHGGLTTLGVNAAMMGLPAILAYQIVLLQRRLGLHGRLPTTAFAFFAGFVGLVAAALIAFVVLIGTIPAFLDANVERDAIAALTLAHVPLAVIEGTLTAMLVLFLLRVRPEMVTGHASVH